MDGQINFHGSSEHKIEITPAFENWLSQVIHAKGYLYSEINFTFCKDDELLRINRKYLNHDFYTDIITFDNTLDKTISADIAISIDRVRENALKEGVATDHELKRVLVHGILHCMGYDDKNATEKEEMRSEENKALSMFHVEHKR